MWRWLTFVFPLDTNVIPVDFIIAILFRGGNISNWARDRAKTVVDAIVM